MSFLEEIAKLTTAAPTIDPELVGFTDQSAFISSKSSDRPYHILDDADVGKPVSRDELFTSDPVEEADDEAADMLARGLDERINGVGSGSDVGSDEEMVSSDEGSDVGSGYETGDSDVSEEEVDKAMEREQEEEEEENIQMVRQRNLQLEELKRDSVKSQQNYWDKLVQLRLKLQPCLQEASKLPPPEKRAKYMSGDVSQSHRQKIITNIQGAIDKLLDVQDQMIDVNCEVRRIYSGEKAVDDDEVPSDTEDEESDKETDPVRKKQKRKRKQNSDFYLSLVKENREKLEKFKSDTILHWYEHTKVVPKKASFLNKEVTVLEQIDHILSNKERLIARTNQNRNTVKFFGESDMDSHPYIFNDDDFYQQLLREIIDKKMGNIDKNDPDSMGRQWAELQKLKVKTKKKVVDTKASKGRKIRYDVHSKLLGFMAPVSTDSLSDSRQDELFKSLFASNN